MRVKTGVWRDDHRPQVSDTLVVWWVDSRGSRHAQVAGSVNPVMNIQMSRNVSHVISRSAEGLLAYQGLLHWVSRAAVTICRTVDCPHWDASLCRGSVGDVGKDICLWYPEQRSGQTCKPVWTVEHTLWRQTDNLHRTKPKTVFILAALSHIFVCWRKDYSSVSGSWYNPIRMDHVVYKNGQNSSVFWVITLREGVLNRRFGTTCYSHPQSSSCPSFLTAWRLDI